MAQLYEPRAWYRSVKQPATDPGDCTCKPDPTEQQAPVQRDAARPSALAAVSCYAARKRHTHRVTRPARFLSQQQQLCLQKGLCNALLGHTHSAEEVPAHPLPAFALHLVSYNGAVLGVHRHLVAARGTTISVNCIIMRLRALSCTKPSIYTLVRSKNSSRRGTQQAPAQTGLCATRSAITHPQSQTPQQQHNNAQTQFMRPHRRSTRPAPAAQSTQLQALGCMYTRQSRRENLMHTQSIKAAANATDKESRDIQSTECGRSPGSCRSVTSSILLGVCHTLPRIYVAGDA